MPVARTSSSHAIRRRDFLNAVPAGLALAGAVALASRLTGSRASTPAAALAATTMVDLSTIPPGQASKALLRSEPVFVRHLTLDEIAQVHGVVPSTLRHPQTLAERTKPGKSQWLVTMGTCTHLGCVLLGAGEREFRGPFGGYFCPCDGSAYDAAGRIRRGPALLNLRVPAFVFRSDSVIEVGAEV